MNQITMSQLQLMAPNVKQTQTRIREKNSDVGKVELIISNDNQTETRMMTMMIIMHER